MISRRTPVKLTIKQAEAHLNVSEITVRRRIKAGNLLAVKEETPQGFVWMVELADEVEPDHLVDHVGYAVTTQPADQRLINELEKQVAWLKSELEDRKREHDRDRVDWRDELQRLHTLMAQQGQTLQALSAGEADEHDAAAHPQEARHEVPAGDVVGDASAPWWRSLTAG
jgi:hypothetical protein